jgi:hypothetical protein
MRGRHDRWLSGGDRRVFYLGLFSARPGTDNDNGDGQVRRAALARVFFAIIAGGLFASAILIFFDRWEGDSRKDRERDLKILRIRRGLDV